MSLLLAAVPWWGRALALAALVAAVFGYGWLQGSDHWQTKLLEAQGKAATEGARISAVRERITTVIVTKYAPQIARQNVITETITKQVPVYVPADSPDLPAGFRLLHDAAATGRLPGAPGGADAAAVPAQDATATVTENYGDCRADKLKLQGLQEWARNQRKVR